MTAALALVPAAFGVGAATMTALARERRRRLRLNRALHELRRPIQALALGAQLHPARADRVHDALDLAMTALADLDGEINGCRIVPARRPVAGRALFEAALERWRGPAAAAGRALEARWRAGRATVLADPAQVSRAIDNLIANAIDHGGLRVGVAAGISAHGLRIEIANDLATSSPNPRRVDDPRHGHGLRVVAEIAAAHGGRFDLRRDDGRTVAVFELPLAASPLPAVASGGARTVAPRQRRRALAA